MAIVVRCECGRQLQAKDEYAGRRTRCPDCGRELTLPGPETEAIEADSPFASPAPRRAPPPMYDEEFRGDRFDKAQPRTSGMAIASLVLGVLSFCLSILTGLPAIILGIISLNKINKSRGELTGQGLAIGGLVTGGIGTLSICVSVALLLPAVQAAREAARRAQCSNNLKQIGLALHNFHDAQNHFPGRAIVDKDGKPLLSWRVAILPYIEQKNLYDKFKLDEPWDSPNNKKLIEEMPKTYLCPSLANPKPGTTTYQAITGKATVFDGKEGLGMRDIPDGASQTLLVVESAEAVPWTKPDDLPIDADPARPLAKPGSKHTGGFGALFGDGSVRFLKSTLDPKILHGLMTRNGAEVIPFDSY